MLDYIPLKKCCSGRRRKNGFIKAKKRNLKSERNKEQRKASPLTNSRLSK